MFDRHVDAFMNGHFPVRIDVTTQDDGTFKGQWTSPAGQVIEVVERSAEEATRRCSDLIRDGVLKREIHLGR